MDYQYRNITFYRFLLLLFSVHWIFAFIITFNPLERWMLLFILFQFILVSCFLILHCVWLCQCIHLNSSLPRQNLRKLMWYCLDRYIATFVASYLKKSSSSKQFLFIIFSCFSLHSMRFTLVLRCLQFYDLLNIFELNGLPSEENPYLFNGDFVDRGSFSVEVILTLFAFKCMCPSGLPFLVL